MNWIEAVSHHFPSAVPCHRFFPKVNWTLEDFGLTPSNTLFAECHCRDEINESAVKRLGRHWGEGFNLSGLAGFPVAGVTGFTAYANHVPDDGHLFIFYGSHIGFDVEGNVGCVKREGMENVTASCGSLNIYLEKIINQNDYEPKFDVYDTGQYLIESVIHPKKEEILKSSFPMVTISEIAFSKIEENILKVIELTGYEGSIYMLGGILINTPLKANDYFTQRSSLSRGKGEKSFKSGWIDINKV